MVNRSSRVAHPLNFCSLRLSSNQLVDYAMVSVSFTNATYALFRSSHTPFVYRQLITSVGPTSESSSRAKFSACTKRIIELVAWKALSLYFATCSDNVHVLNSSLCFLFVFLCSLEHCGLEVGTWVVGN